MKTQQKKILRNQKLTAVRPWLAIALMTAILMDAQHVVADDAVKASEQTELNPGATLVAQNPAPPAKKKRRVVRKKKGAKSSGSSRWSGGVLLGYMQDTMDVKLTSSSSSESFSKTGAGIGLGGFADYALLPYLRLRGILGYEQFKASGTSAQNRCTGSSACNTEINYVTFTAWARYLIMTKRFRPWLGLGIGWYFPSSVTSNTLDTTAVSTATVLSPGLGFDYWMKANWYFTAQFEYGMFLPPSDEVTTKSLGGRVGVGFTF
ncbi:MAG: hypothetical protein COT74_12175 [Bdellovibrionales bacterium CG10_big_fil_rev_8_21_14_0_10_45_34]|nr:MAG: hypothetical protein COT74_12175 [Bdellovibrionales bacterium CG10_big_fil_rev_8_21_14_0_10_45_34]